MSAREADARREAPQGRRREAAGALLGSVAEVVALFAYGLLTGPWVLGFWNAADAVHAFYGVRLVVVVVWVLGGVGLGAVVRWSLAPWVRGTPRGH